jgi:hypothetical protein
LVVSEIQGSDPCPVHRTAHKIDERGIQWTSYCYSISDHFQGSLAAAAAVLIL